MLSRPKYRFPAIRPVIPPPEVWAHRLGASYSAKWFSNFGPVVEQFETALTDHFCCDGETMSSASNATSALAAALIMLDVRGTALIPAFTFPATASAVIMAGAQPCVLDVDPDTWCLCPAKLEATLRVERCGAVVLVAPFGIQQDFSNYFEICSRHGAALIIDNAAGLGVNEAALPDPRCLEIYSLHATKPFPIGEGGAIRSSTKQKGALRRALNFGLKGPETSPGRWGINGKMSEVAAAIGLAVLESFDSVISRRRAVAMRYVELLRDFPSLPTPPEVDRAPWQVFPVLLPSAGIAEQFVGSAAENGLQVRRGYQPSLEDWPGTRKLGPCPNACSLAERMVLLPVYSDATEEEVVEISEIVTKSLRAALARNVREI